MFSDKRVPDEILRQTFDLKDNRDWDLSSARKSIMTIGNDASMIQTITYRPFDSRFILFSEYLIDWPRMEVMQHMLRKNLGLCLSRRVEIDRLFDHVLIANEMITHHSVSLKEVNYLFPLYLYKPSDEKKKKAQHSNHAAS